jgi:hypothetical protein
MKAREYRGNVTTIDEVMKLNRYLRDALQQVATHPPNDGEFSPFNIQFQEIDVVELHLWAKIVEADCGDLDNLLGPLFSIKTSTTTLMPKRQRHETTQRHYSGAVECHTRNRRQVLGKAWIGLKSVNCATNVTSDPGRELPFVGAAIQHYGVRPHQWANDRMPVSANDPHICLWLRTACDESWIDNVIAKQMTP